MIPYHLVNISCFGDKSIDFLSVLCTLSVHMRHGKAQDASSNSLLSCLEVGSCAVSFLLFRMNLFNRNHMFGMSYSRALGMYSYLSLLV